MMRMALDCFDEDRVTTLYWCHLSCAEHKPLGFEAVLLNSDHLTQMSSPTPTPVVLAMLSVFLHADLCWIPSIYSTPH